MNYYQNTPKNANITRYIKKKQTLCNTLNWGNWYLWFVKLGVRWAEQDIRQITLSYKEFYKAWGFINFFACTAMKIPKKIWCNQVEIRSHGFIAVHWAMSCMYWISLDFENVNCIPTYTHALLSFPCSFLPVNHHNNKNWVPSILTHNCDWSSWGWSKKKI